MTKRTKYGQFMYNLTYKGGLFLEKHIYLYYILACTWGIIMTLLGCLITLVLLCCGRKPHKYHRVYYFKIFEWWGGVEMGLMFIRDKRSNESVSKHELGHTYQNALLGPLFVFLVAIPSAIRYWYRELTHKKLTTSYDDMWFEGCATDLGTEIITQRNIQKAEEACHV